MRFLKNDVKDDLFHVIICLDFLCIDQLRNQIVLV
jgi:hypothetical protein